VGKESMDSRALEILEFDLIKEMVGEFAISEMGREMIRHQEVATSPEVILAEYELVREMIGAISGYQSIPLDGLCDIRSSLSAISPPGTYLDPPDILRIDRLLKTAVGVRSFFETPRESFPRLHRLMQQCESVPDFEKAVRAALTPDGEVASSATPELADIRRTMASISRKIEASFERMIRSPEISEFLQEGYVTERKGRRVLPVRSDVRSRVPGIVHDVSISGGTVFIEPMAVVGLSNEFTDLAAREREEIRRILLSLSDCLRRNLPVVLTNVEIMAKVDMLYSKARLAERYKCSIPAISADRSLRIENGRHPLLLKSQEERCVPLNCSLRSSDSALVISGPNAGGKTTAAKTIAILCLMAQTSTPIPTGANSVLPILSGFFADIGDYQDISLGVSTFTSHLGEIKRILENVCEGSLVVLDELGTATDPTEGAALAETILEELSRKGALAVVTSHLPSLKTLGETREWARSASMGLDPQTERPNFILSMDVPGESSGLTIARQIGIPRHIIDRAYSLMSRQQRDLRRALESVRKEKARLLSASKDLAEARREVKEQKKLCRELRQSLDAEMKKLRLEKLQFRQKILAEKDSILREARMRVEKTIARLPSRKQLPRAREELREEHRRLEKEAKEVGDAIERLSVVPRRELDREEIREGMVVWARKLRQSGTVKAVYPGKKKVDLIVDGVVFTVDANQLAEFREEEKVTAPPAGRSSLLSKHLASTDLNLIGQRVEKAIGLLDRFLNDASLSGADKVRIIHGYGTGALRKAVREFLASHPLVDGFRSQNEEEGDRGAVTVVKLK